MATSISTVQPSLGLVQYLNAFGTFAARGDGTGLDGAASNNLIGAIHTFAGIFRRGPLWRVWRVGAYRRKH